MAYYATAEERDRLVAGLRGLADFLECNPAVPALKYATVYVFPPGEINAERRAEIDVIGSHIDTQAGETVPGHYVASRFFGPVEYRAVAIDDETPENGEGA